MFSSELIRPDPSANVAGSWRVRDRSTSTRRVYGLAVHGEARLYVLRMKDEAVPGCALSGEAADLIGSSSRRVVGFWGVYLRSCNVRMVGVLDSGATGCVFSDEAKG